MARRHRNWINKILEEYRNVLVFVGQGLVINRGSFDFPQGIKQGIGPYLVERRVAGTWIMGDDTIDRISFSSAPATGAVLSTGLPGVIHRLPAPRCSSNGSSNRAGLDNYRPAAENSGLPTRTFRKAVPAQRLSRQSVQGCVGWWGQPAVRRPSPHPGMSDPPPGRDWLWPGLGLA